MAKPNAGIIDHPFSLYSFRKFETDPRKLAQYLRQMPQDYYVEMLDFQEGTITGQVTASSNGTSPTAFAANAQRNGAIRGATGTTSNNSTAVYYTSAIFDAADRPFFMIRFKMPAAVTALRMECIWSDPKTNEYAQTVTDVDTPTVANGVTDGGGFAWDTAQTLATPALVGVGTSTTAAKTNIVDRAGTVWTPTASKWIDLCVWVQAAQTYMSVWQDGAPVGVNPFAVASGPDAGVLMRPSFYVETTNTTTKAVDIDFLLIGAERNQA